MARRSLRHELRGGFVRPPWRVPRSGSRRSAGHRRSQVTEMVDKLTPVEIRPLIGDLQPHVSALRGYPGREMNSDDVAATRRRHRCQAAVYSTLMIAPLSSWNCQHSNDEFPCLGGNAHSLVGISRGNHYRSCGVERPTAHSYWFGNRSESLSAYRRAQGRMPPDKWAYSTLGR